MSTTYFKNVRALKTEKTIYNNYKTNVYLLIVKTAESNVLSNSGKHCYHEWIYASGEYDEVMRKVFNGAINFDVGSDVWKPNKKDSIGFIKICKKALDNAVETTMIPNNIYGTVYWGLNKDFDFIFDVFENKENIMIKYNLGSKILVTKDILTYIEIKRKIDSMIDDYHNKVIYEEGTMKFKEFMEKHKDWYNLT